mmetsp:Transcript_14238/g.26712  ORF Transcript_14238/g.26712 Transcript_14238/m.26712 type:complete len:754 (-) Transcript_14238:1694-3955(-)
MKLLSSSQLQQSNVNKDQSSVIQSQQKQQQQPPPLQSSSSSSSSKQTPSKQTQSQHQQLDNELYNSDASLIIAHEINTTFFKESTTISKKQLSLWKLSTFFQKVCKSVDLFTYQDNNGHHHQIQNTTLLPPPTTNNNHTVQLSSEFKKARDKLIKDAIQKVYKELEDDSNNNSSSTSLASRLIIRRVDYDEATLKPLLQNASLWLLHELHAVWKEDCAFRQRYEAWMRDINAERREYSWQVKKLTTERDEYRAMVEKLVMDNDAVVLASSSLSSSNKVSGCLALHQVLFLEIMPWDVRVKDYISSKDEVYQWQVWDDWLGKWSDKKVKNVGFFQKLPINKMKRRNDREDHVGESSVVDSAVEGHRRSSPVRKIQHAFDSLSLRGRFLTDAKCTCVLDLSEGYPLPTSGAWEWVGNWSLLSVDGMQSSSPGRRYDARSNKNNHPTTDDEADDIGWTYADTVDALCHHNDDSRSGEKSPSTQNSAQSTSKFRRRTWTRERVLVSYPGISPATKQMLEMNAHNTRLTLAMSKLHGQVHDMQMKLFQKEEELEVMQEEMMITTGKKKMSNDNIDQQNTSLDSQSQEDVVLHHHAARDTTPMLPPPKINLDEEIDISIPVPTSPPTSPSALITVDEMKGAFENRIISTINHGSNETKDRMKDENTTAETSMETDTTFVDDNDHQQTGALIARQESDQLTQPGSSVAALPKRFDNYGSWIMNSDFILESMKNNVQSAKHSVQTISKKAQHIIVNSKTTR